MQFMDNIDDLLNLMRVEKQNIECLNKRAEYHKQYYIKNRDRIIAMQKEYRKRCKVDIKKRARNRYQKNRAYFLEKSRQYRVNKFKFVSLNEKEKVCQSEQIVKHQENTTTKIERKS